MKTTLVNEDKRYKDKRKQKENIQTKTPPVNPSRRISIPSPLYLETKYRRSGHLFTEHDAPVSQSNVELFRPAANHR